MSLASSLKILYTAVTAARRVRRASARVEPTSALSVVDDSRRFSVNAPCKIIGVKLSEIESFVETIIDSNHANDEWEPNINGDVMLTITCQESQWCGLVILYTTKQNSVHFQGKPHLASSASLQMMELLQSRGRVKRTRTGLKMHVSAEVAMTASVRVHRDKRKMSSKTKILGVSLDDIESFIDIIIDSEHATDEWVPNAKSDVVLSITDARSPWCGLIIIFSTKICAVQFEGKHHLSVKASTQLHEYIQRRSN
jgi:hypothetical protein